MASPQPLDADIALISVLAEPDGPTLPLAAADPAQYGKAALLTLGYQAGAAGGAPAIKVSSGSLVATPADATGRLHADGPAEPWSVGGPALLTATGLATPLAVRNAALLAFAVAAVVGAVLSIVVDPWLLLLVLLNRLGVLSGWFLCSHDSSPVSLFLLLTWMQG